MFSWEFCEFSKNTFFTEHLRMTASVCNSLLLSHFNCVTEELNTVSNVYQFIRRQSCHHIETSQLICLANQLIGFYTMATLAFNELMLVTIPLQWSIDNAWSDFFCKYTYFRIDSFQNHHFLIHLFPCVLFCCILVFHYLILV